MATSKKPAAKAAKPAKKPAVKAKVAPAKKPAKAAAKPVSKPASKVAARPAVAVVKQMPKLHTVSSNRGRSNAPSPKWMDDCLKLARKNPAVTLVALIAAALGVMLLAS